MSTTPSEATSPTSPNLPASTQGTPYLPDPSKGGGVGSRLRGSPSKMPPWLERMLVAQGKLDVDGFAVKARVRFCRQCGAPTIRGLDAPVMGVPSTLDVLALTDEQEVLALVAGRRTHRVIYAGQRGYELGRWRDADAIRSSPASKTLDVHAEHRCGAVAGSVSDRRGFSGPRTTPTTVPGF